VSTLVGSADTVAITGGPLSLNALVSMVTREGPDGAIATFLGVVRGENAGRTVRHLEYECYEPLAIRALRRIQDEAAEHWPTARIACHHRVGRLEIGEASVVIAVASPHRSDAFAACRYVIERVKQIVPIWKHEHFDGGDAWIEGAVADPDDRASREAALTRAGL
jgi:molybdopterin synthase catalytic subunit